MEQSEGLHEKISALSCELLPTLAFPSEFRADLNYAFLLARSQGEILGSGLQECSALGNEANRSRALNRKNVKKCKEMQSPWKIKLQGWRGMG